MSFVPLSGCCIINIHLTLAFVIPKLAYIRCYQNTSLDIHFRRYLGEMESNHASRMAPPLYVSPEATFEHIEYAQATSTSGNFDIERRLAINMLIQKRLNRSAEMLLSTQGSVTESNGIRYDTSIEYSNDVTGVKVDGECQEQTIQNKKGKEIKSNDGEKATYLGYYFGDVAREPFNNPHGGPPRLFSPRHALENSFYSRFSFEGQDDGCGEYESSRLVSQENDSRSVITSPSERHEITECWRTGANGDDYNSDEEACSSVSPAAFPPSPTRSFPWRHMPPTEAASEGSSTTTSNTIFTPDSTPSPSDHSSELSIDESDHRESATYSDRGEEPYETDSESSRNGENTPTKDSDVTLENLYLDDIASDEIQHDSGQPKDAPAFVEKTMTGRVPDLTCDELIRHLQAGWTFTVEYDEDGDTGVYLWEPESWWSNLLGWFLCWFLSLLLAMGLIFAVCVKVGGRV